MRKSEWFGIVGGGLLGLVSVVGILMTEPPTSAQQPHQPAYLSPGGATVRSTGEMLIEPFIYMPPTQLSPQGVVITAEHPDWPATPFTAPTKITISRTFADDVPVCFELPDGTIKCYPIGTWRKVP